MAPLKDALILQTENCQNELLNLKKARVSLKEISPKSS